MTTITDPVVIENACDEMLSHEEESVGFFGLDL